MVIYCTRKFEILIGPTLEVDFINILRAAFERADPKSAQKTDNLTVFFALLGSAHVKAARRTLMKLTPSHIDGKAVMEKTQTRFEKIFCQFYLLAFICKLF